VRSTNDKKVSLLSTTLRQTEKNNEKETKSTKQTVKIYYKLLQQITDIIKQRTFD